MEHEESEKVQSLLCVGISKLMLAGMISDERVGSIRFQDISGLRCGAGSEESYSRVHVSRNSSESGTTSMPFIFLPGVLLLICNEPTANAAGRWP